MEIFEHDPIDPIILDHFFFLSGGQWFQDLPSRWPGRGRGELDPGCGAEDEERGGRLRWTFRFSIQKRGGLFWVEIWEILSCSFRMFYAIHRLAFMNNSTRSNSWQKNGAFKTLHLLGGFVRQKKWWYSKWFSTCRATAWVKIVYPHGWASQWISMTSQSCILSISW